MNLDPIRLLERLHGHLGWLAVAALIHPAIVLRKRDRRAPWAVAAGTTLVTVTGALGAVLYPPYRDRIKRSIFIDAPWIGYAFERKEHLAFGAVAFALAGAVAYGAASLSADQARAPLRTLAHRAYLFAALLATAAALLGTVVASFRSF